MPLEKKAIRLRLGKAPRKLIEKLEELTRALYGVEFRDYVHASYFKYVCFDEICIISAYDPRYTLDIANVTILYSGMWVAIHVKNVLAPSIPLVKSIYDKTGVKAAIIVAEKGVKAFLYGNDILAESVVKVIPPHVGLYAVVDSTDGEIVGFAKWNGTKKVYENVYDLGVFLRALG
ncbi:MAG: hypothetical protein ACP5KA_01065 [Desulfurococcaceae archaeon]|jgi:ribosome biogenesis protein Nip4